MKKNKIILGCLLLLVAPVTQAQQLSVKPYLAYHHAVTSQAEPVFHLIPFHIPSYHSTGPYIYAASAHSEDFTLANGVECGLTVDYRFPSQLGVELGVGYFFSTKTYFEHNKQRRQILHMPVFSVDWNYRSIAIRPMFSYAVVKGKSTFIGKAGPVIHIATATMNTTLPYRGPISSDFNTSMLPGEKGSAGTFGTRANWGYALGLEYSYQLFQRLSFTVELGFEQYRYTPGKATVEYDDYYYGRQTHNIIYVDEYAPPANSLYGQEGRYERGETYYKLKESVLFSSISFGMAVKYNLWKK